MICAAVPAGNAGSAPQARASAAAGLGTDDRGAAGLAIARLAVARLALT